MDTRDSPRVAITARTQISRTLELIEKVISKYQERDGGGWALMRPSGDDQRSVRRHPYYWASFINTEV